MKKQIILFLCILLIGANLAALAQGENQAKAAPGPQVIPDEAIRLRILANSDSEKDQHLKRIIRDRVNASINEWVEELTSIEAAREIIRGNLPEIEKIVATVMQEQGASQMYSVEFDKVKFPTKLYGNFIYPAGTYEAILISIGEAEGANWWCVLFPPLCFLDFSNGEAVDNSSNGQRIEESAQESKQEEVEVKFFLVEIFSNLFENLKELFS